MICAHVVLHLRELRQSESRALWSFLRFQHAQEAEILSDVVDHEAQQKTVVQSGQLFFFGEFVAGAEKSEQRHRADFFAVVEQALVNQS